MRQPTSQRPVSQRHHIGIKWKMYFILILFIGIVVGVIWFFQVRMLNYFYQVTKFNELELASSEISGQLGRTAQAEKIAQDYAAAYYTDIWVYHVSQEGDASLLFDAKGTGDPDISFMTRKFSILHDKAVINGGVYIAMVQSKQFQEEFELKIIKDNSEDPTVYPTLFGTPERISAIHVSVKTAHGEEFMIVQSTTLTPIQAMVKTLQNQSLWIAFILSSLALIMAGFMSRLITKPIVTMNKAAKQLAQGHYDAHFAGNGYREIHELAESLNYASRELAKTDHLQKELISNISHDLRTPLTMIKGYGEVMRDIPGENTAENIQIIIDETSRLSELVNDMLDLSRIQAGTRKPEFQQFSLTATVRDTMLRYERLMMQEGYHIEFYAEEEADVIADRGMILQVVYNLINNAINYTGEDKSVSVRQEVRADRVRIRVLDTGEGIAEDQLEMIWDRYYKVDKVHRRATVGTGLGLSIVREILETHHAAYGVQSTLGKGSEFWFELPIAPDASLNQADYIEADYETQETERDS
ncbi:MAG: HAMP domain-containing histidine kinase [Clostridia bacterium]|nr:HAMP domain-containing histidine kinase [Clostridia bacterium]